MAAVLKSTGMAAGYTRDQLNSMADSFADATSFSGGDISQAQTALLAFTGIVGQEFPRALQAAADMASRTGTTVKQAAELIGRSLDVPSAGLASLSKQGFRFSDEQKKLVDSLESVGDVAAAQGIVLQALESTYGGAATAARDTLGGALQSLGNTINDLLTDSGGLNAAKLAVQALTETLDSPRAKDALILTAKAAAALAGVLVARLASAALGVAAAFVATQIGAFKVQLALAAMSGISTTAATGLLAVSAASRVAAASMAFLGGPVGILITAAAALTYFITSSDSAKESAGALAEQVDWLNKSFEGFTKNQSKAALTDLTKEYRLQAYAIDAAKNQVKQYQMNLEAFPKNDKVKEWSAGLIEQSAVLDTARQKFEALGTQISLLNSRLAAPDAALGSKVYEEMSKKIQERLLLAGKTTDAEKLEARVKAGLVEGLKAGEGELLVAAQKRADVAEAAADATKKADEAAKSAAKSAAEALERRGADAEESYQRQIALIDQTTGKQNKASEVAKLSFELESGKLKGISAERRKGLMDQAAELDGRIKLKKQNEEDLKLAVLASNLKDSNTTVRQGFEMELAGAGSGEKLRARLKEDLAIQQDYEKQRAEMYKEYKQAELLGDPSAKANYDAETALLEEALAERIIIQQDHYRQQDEAQSNWMTGVSDAWQNYVDAAQNYTAQAAEATTSVLDSAQSGLSNFISDVASGAATAGDALGDLVANFAKSTLQALSDMAAQWLIYQAVQLLVGKTTQASAVPTLVANAQATAFQASLAAFASTAAIPIVGPAAAPAAAAAAAAATAPMVAGVASAALAGMAHDGIDAVPETGTWLLQKGERVTTAGTSAKLDATLDQLRASSANSGGAGGITVNAPVTVQAQPGTSDADARRQGEMAGEGLTATIRRVLQGEMGQGGLLWRRV
ncbi:phage tail tape measure protein, lambda family [Pseudomonas prosekii]|uniref:Phage tail tape measure protein, lambda family n=1 Tax=Pseudomonas prosekii TaxID=1148509 RepID=A0A1H1S1A7_9PSED|nr:phage tail tape measure protein, lambda family [Pseudomonas prosekii]